MRKKLFCTAIIYLILSFLMIEALILNGMRSDAEPGAEYVIILGAGLYGETPSQILSKRLQAAERYLKENFDTIAVVSGGQGEGETVTEAEAMRRWLTRAGIAPERILMEDKSRNTGENIAFSKAVIGADAETSRIVVVSSEFHLFRARAICTREKMSATALAADTPTFVLKVKYFLREYVSVGFMFFGR